MAEAARQQISDIAFVPTFFGLAAPPAIELAAKLGVPFREADLDLYDAYTADEAFITSTSLCICPVASINGNVGAWALSPDGARVAFVGSIAGEPERETRARRERDGIAVDETTWAEILAAGAKLKLKKELLQQLAEGR